MNEKERQRLVTELTSIILPRKKGLCNIIEYKVSRSELFHHETKNQAHKVIYRRYASLFFVFGVDWTDNELITLECIHRYVECLNDYFGNVNELDIIYNAAEAFHVLDELFMCGHIADSSKKSVLKRVRAFDETCNMDALTTKLHESSLL